MKFACLFVLALPMAAAVSLFQNPQHAQVKQSLTPFNFGTLQQASKTAPQQTLSQLLPRSTQVSQVSQVTKTKVPQVSKTSLQQTVSRIIPRSTKLFPRSTQVNQQTNLGQVGLKKTAQQVANIIPRSTKLFPRSTQISQQTNLGQIVGQIGVKKTGGFMPRTGDVPTDAPIAMMPMSPRSIQQVSKGASQQQTLANIVPRSTKLFPRLTQVSQQTNVGMKKTGGFVPRTGDVPTDAPIAMMPMSPRSTKLFPRSTQVSQQASLGQIGMKKTGGFMPRTGDVPTDAPIARMPISLRSMQQVSKGAPKQSTQLFPRSTQVSQQTSLGQVGMKKTGGFMPRTGDVPTDAPIAMMPISPRSTQVNQMNLKNQVNAMPQLTGGF